MTTTNKFQDIYGFSHELSYGPRVWWVSTRKFGEPFSGMPLEMFIIDNPEGFNG